MPGDAPCAAASITAPTDASTEELHAAVDDVPIGMLNVTLADSTTVVGGTDDREGVADALSVLESDSEEEGLLESVAEEDAVDESERDRLALVLSEGSTVTEELIVELALAEGEVV